MESAPGEHNASKSASEDIISKMPDDVMANILDRLPIQYALRTAILSRNWRFKWTLLRCAVFDEQFSKYLQGLRAKNLFDERNINRLLLLLKGSITKFHLYIPSDKKMDVNDINYWVMFLSRNGIKEFNLINMNITTLMLSSHLFYCVNLEHLTLRNCSLYLAPTFGGFPNLLSLDLYQVAFENGDFGEFITQCPLLECLKVNFCDRTGKVKMVDIVKLENLTCLYLQLCNLDTTTFTSSSIFHLVGHFSKLQELSLDLNKCKFLGESGAGNWVRTFFGSLATLMLYPIDFGSDIMLSFAFDMIWGSPELDILKITATYNDAVRPPAFCSSALNHISMEQLKLRIVEFKCFRGSEIEICLIKNLLACSPLLEKIDIYVTSSRMFGGDIGKLMFATKLLKLHRASSTAEVNIYWS